MVHNIHYTLILVSLNAIYSMVVTDFTMNPNLCSGLHCWHKKLGIIYSSSNFRHKITWDKKRWWSSYNNASFIARAYHLKRKYHDTPKFGLGLQCYAVQPKFHDTLYCPPMLRLQTIKTIVNSRKFKGSSSDEPRRVQVLYLYCLTRFESENSRREDVY